MKLKIKAATTSLIQLIFIGDSSSSTGAGLTGLTNSSSGLVCYYKTDNGSASVASTLVTITTLGTYAGTSTNTGFKEVDATNMPGVYELHLCNNAIAAGVKRVVVMLKGATNMVPTALEIECDAIDYQDTVRMGLTALPNVASGNAGALITSGTGTAQLSTSSGLVTPVATQSFVLQTGTAQAGAASTITLASAAVATNNYYTGNIVQIVSGTGIGQSRTITGYVGSTKVATVDIPWAVTPDATSVYSVTSFRANRITTLGGTASAGGASTITMTGGVATDNYYAGQLVSIIGGTGVGQARTILSYVGSTAIATVDRAWAVAPDSTSIFVVTADSLSQTDSNLRIQVQAGTGAGQLDFTAGVLKANITQLLGTAWLTPATPGTPDVNVKLVAGQTQTARDLGANLDVAVSSRSTYAGADTAGTTTLLSRIASALTITGGKVDINDKTGFSLATGQSNIVHSGTAQAGTASSITLASSAASVSGVYNGSYVTIVSGTGAGQTGLITNYFGSTKLALISTTWAVTPDTTSQYIVTGVKAPYVDNSGNVLSNILHSGTAQAGSSFSITLANTAPSVDSFYVGTYIIIVSGTGAGQVTYVNSYVGSTKVAGTTKWYVSPDSTSQYVVVGVKAPFVDNSGRVQIVPSQSLASNVSPNATFAQSGTSTTITLASITPGADNIINGCQIQIYAGTGLGQVRTITAYNSTTKVATVSPPWITIPDSSSQYSVLTVASPVLDSSLRVDVGKIAGTVQTARDIGASVLISPGTGAGQLDVTSGVIKSNVIQLLGTAWLTPTVAGTPDVNTISIGANAVSDTAISANAVTKIQLNLATASSISTLQTTANSINSITGALPDSGALTTIQSGISNIQTRLPSSLVGGKIDSNIGSQSINVAIDLTQSVPTTNTAQTVGDALNAARADGFGKWVLSGTTLTLYAGDGTTVVRTFTLNSATSPTSRT